MSAATRIAATPESRNVRSGGTMGRGRLVAGSTTSPHDRRVDGARRVSSAVVRQLAQDRTVVASSVRNGRIAGGGTQ